jgi:hypothetical protein
MIKAQAPSVASHLLVEAWDLNLPWILDFGF